MPDLFVIDEIHTTIFVHRDVEVSKIRAIRRALQRGAFQKRLEQATRSVIAKYPSMRHVQFSLSR